MTWWQPLALASSPFSSEPTVPITVAPRLSSHWHAIRPTPPAAACRSTASPGCTANVRRTRYSTVHPFTMIAAAVSGSIPSGSRTRRARGRTRASRYEPIGPLLVYATGSPGARSSTPSPARSTTPAPSTPGVNGGSTGYNPVRW